MASARPVALVALISNALIAINSLVFINASSPFVLTTLLGVSSSRSGALVGTLLLADELTALAVYLPVGVWTARGRYGVKGVACAGHCVVALALVAYVQARNFGQLLVARVLFAVGAGTLVTTLSSMLSFVSAPLIPPDHPPVRVQPDEETALLCGTSGGSTAGGPAQVGCPVARKHPAGKLAGFMGFASGMGALLAVFVFLRLPTPLSRFFASHYPSQPSDALGLKATFYLVALTSLVEAGKKIKAAMLELVEGFRLAAGSGEVALGYLSSFASRAQAIIITTYIPLLVNRYLTDHDLCDPSSLLSLTTSSSPLKQTCRRAYILSSILTGSVQLLSLLLSPLLGYLSSSSFSLLRRRTSLSLSSSSPPSPSAVLTLSFLLGSLAFLGFSLFPNGGDPRASISWLYVVGMGIAQAAGVVLSLALVTTGSVGLSRREGKEVGGSLAGSYAVSGGLGILIVGSLSGFLFDHVSSGAPFMLMAAVDAIVALGSAVLWLRS
ncbi:hypothetical protein JCM8547_008884 [Rhodosporidiobolus lusitaniae]